MRSDVLKNLRAMPDPGRALENYRRMAPAYESSCRRIQALRELAVQHLSLKAGETVFDLACGTGATLPSLSRDVGPEGLAVGVEQCPEMAELARQRIKTLTASARIAIVQGAVETFEPDARADAVLMCFAHDVLQSPAALQRLLAIGKPGARVVLLGLRTLPWWWAWPLNLFNLFRARRYLTTYAGMARPWQLLASRGAAFEVIDSALWSSIYIAVGRLPGSTGADTALVSRHAPDGPGLYF